MKNILPAQFLKNVTKVAAPISLQFLIMSAVNLIDTIMVGSLGDGAVAAAGAGNQIFFLLNLFIFGVSSGSTVFLAQFWGKKDVKNVHRTMGYMLTIGVIVALMFTIGAVFFPRILVGFYLHEQAVIDLAAGYIRIVGMSYIITALSNMLATTLRCTGNVKLPMGAAITAVLVNVVGNSVLIFGLFGAPKLGLAGAAIATALARCIELFLLLYYTYKYNLPPAVRLKSLFAFEKEFTKRYFKTALPVILNEVIWSVGMSMYTVAYGLMGTNTMSAAQIANTIIQLLFVFARGVGNASGIMMGKVIGAGEIERAKREGRQFMVFSVLVGIFSCVVVMAITPIFLGFYNVSEQTLQIAQTMLWIQAPMLIIRSLNVIIIVGLLRAGGDTIYCLAVDGGSVWLVGVPLTLLAVHLGAPVALVTAAIMTDEIAKLLASLPRVRSNKWARSVIEDIK